MGCHLAVAPWVACRSHPPSSSGPEAETLTTPDVPWVTVVWNDPVNLMTYVAFVFQEYFGYDRKKAEKLMLQVHEEGRSAVSTGSARGDGARRRRAARLRAVGHHAAGPMTIEFAA